MSETFIEVQKQKYLYFVTSHLCNLIHSRIKHLPLQFECFWCPTHTPVTPSTWKKKRITPSCWRFQPSQRNELIASFERVVEFCSCLTRKWNQDTLGLRQSFFSSHFFSLTDFAAVRMQSGVGPALLGSWLMRRKEHFITSFKSLYNKPALRARRSQNWY